MVFHASPAATCVIGGDGRIVEANLAFARLSGQPPEALAGAPADCLFGRTSDTAPREVSSPLPVSGQGIGVIQLAGGTHRNVTFAVSGLGQGRRLVVVTDIAEDICAACQIFSSREKFRTAFDDQSELICRFLPDFTVILVNREFALMFGRTPRELVGRDLRDVLPVPSMAAVRVFLAQATPRQPMASSEDHWTTEAGEERWITWRRLALFDSEGQMTSIQSVGRDTTQRRQVEAERARLEAMVNRSPVVGIGWRVGGRQAIEFVTGNAGRLALDPQRLRASEAGLSDFLHPDDRAAFAAWAGTCPVDGPAAETTVRVVDDAGEIRWVAVRGWRTEGAGGERFEAVLLDVTEQRNASLALRERELRFQAIFDNAFEFVGLLTPDGRIIEANAPALAFIGVDSAAVCGQFFWETPWWTHSPDAQARLRHGVAQAVRGEFVRFETTHRGPGRDTIQVDFSLRPIYDEAGRVMFLVPEGRDITHLKETQAALTEAMRDAEMANRSKTQFLAVVSHELRTPLNAVLGYSEIMQNAMFGPIGNTRYAGYVDAIHTSGQHLLGIIDDILEISRIELGVLELDEEQADPGELARRTAKILANRAAEVGIGLTLDIAGDLPALHCDVRRVIQMLVNLVYNGIKFSRPRGVVALAVKRQGDALAFVVSDCGAGIAREDMHKVWEAFGQAGSAHIHRGGGVGLGLTITRALIEAHGGEIRLDSEPGKGTTVTMVFPASRCGVPSTPRDNVPARDISPEGGEPAEEGHSAHDTTGHFQK
jgi:PAS domain S-box-containing protein